MKGKLVDFSRRSAVALAAAFACAACSTYSLTIDGTAADGMNPNRAGGSSTLHVYAFFLKKPDAFLQKDKTLVDFVVKSVTEEGKVPPFLEAEAVDVERIEVACPAQGKTTNVTKTFDVPNDVTSVGLVAVFQSHRDGDPEETWRIVLPVESKTVSFEVAGRRIAQATPKKPAPRKASDG